MDMRPVSGIIIGERFRKDLGDIAGLARSISGVGLLHPVFITPDGRLISGERRLEACKRLGWTEIPVRVVDLADVVRGEHDENLVRKDFLPSEAVAIAKALEPVEREAAKERQGTRTDRQPSGNFPEGAPGRTRDKVAAYAGISGKTLEKAVKIVEAAEKEPEKFTPLVEQMDKTGRVDGVYRKLKVLKQAEEINGEPPPLPTGPFRVIVADPPWPYDKRAGDPSHRADLPYPAMTIEDIKALPVQGLSCGDSILWLWTTNAHMRVAFDVLDAWGFEPKTILTWVKNQMSNGDWLRGKTEHCIMAVRGEPTVVLTNQTTVLYGPRREHSRKPDEFYQLVESLCPGSKVELFARTARKGWAAHGNDTDKFPGVA